jgi:hypothetical protein
MTAVGTPAFWAYYASLHHEDGEYAPRPIGDNLFEDAVVCLLCGHGVPSEVGLASFWALKGAALLDRPYPAAAYEAVMLAPMDVYGRSVRYRFPRTRAVQIAAAAAALHGTDLSGLGDHELRDFLMRLPGIGPKIGSFILRNHRGSDQVAVLDVHLVRVGKAAGFFKPDDLPQRNYFEMEREFLRFAHAIGARPAELDMMMWDYSRTLGYW